MVKLKVNVIHKRLYSTDAILRAKQIKAPFRKSHPGPPKMGIPKRRGYTKSIINKKSRRFLSPHLYKRGKGIAAKKSGIKRDDKKKQKSKKYSKRKKFYAIGGQKKYRGVQQNKGGKYFTQKIINGKNTTLGTFAVAEDAAKCFDLETFRQKGRSYKHYNFPENLEKYAKIVAAERRSTV